ncbi:phage tail tape measure protein [Spirosoma fluminis]
MAKTQNERAVIDLVINGQAAKITLKDISLAVTKTRSELNKMKEEDNPAAYKAKLAEMHKLVNAQRDMTARINDTSTAWGRFKKEMATVTMGVVGGNVITFMLQQLVALIPSTIERTMKLKDAFADIEKATGLSSEGVKALNKELKNIDTRTSNSELRNIAIAGGQLGVANDQLVDFVKNVDMAVVALGDEFTGGVEEVAKTLGGIGKLFDETRDNTAGDNIKAIGSAINELGAAGSATGPVVAEFTTRMGQLGGLAPKLAETMGLGAAMQELGLSAEIAASGLSGLMLTAANRSDLFAQHLGMSKKAVEDLINTDPNKFLMTLAKSFAGLSSTQVAQRLKELKVESQESIKVMSLLADQTDFVAQKQKLAAKALAEKTSLQEEYNKKNHQLARDLKALNEWFNNLFTSEGVQMFLMDALHGAVEFIKVLKDVGSWLNKTKDYFYIAAMATAAYYASTMKATASTIANTVAELARKAAYELGFRWLVITEAATKAYALATGVLTGQISLQTAVVTVARTAWSAFSAVLLLNPIGLVITALAGLVAGIKYFSDNSERALDIERKKQRIQRQSILNTELSAKALKDLNEKVAGFNELSVKEQENIRRTIVLKQQEARARLATALARAREVARENAEPSFWQGVKQGAGNLVTGKWGTLLDSKALEQQRKQIAEENKAAAYEEAKRLANVEQLKADLEKFDDLLAQTNPKTASTKTGGTLNEVKDPDKKGKKDKKTDAEKEAEELEKMLADSRERIMQGEKTQYENEVAAFAEKYTRMYDLAKDNQAKIDEIKRLSLLEFAEIDKRRLEQDRLLEKKKLEQSLKDQDIDLQAYRQGELDKLRIDKAAGRITDTQFEGRSLEAEMKYLLAKKAIHKKFYDDVDALGIQSEEKRLEISKQKAEDEAELEKQITENLTQQIEVRIQKSDEFTAKSIANEKRRKEATKQLIEEVLAMMMINWEEQLKGLKEFWQKSSTIQKAAFVASKAMAVAEATVAYARTLMNILANTPNPWAAVGYSTLATGTYATVLSKIASANYAAPAFADGGFSNPEGFTKGPTMYSGSTGPFLAGERGTEFIINNRALQNPVIADFARMMDAMQRSGNYSMLSQGLASASSESISPLGLGSGTRQASGLSDQAITMLVREQQLTRQKLEEVAKRPIVQNYRLLEEYQDQVQQIRQENTL